MKRTQIDALFGRAYNGQPNFLTPHIITRGKRGAHVYEISCGEGFGGGTIYGVTVLTLRGEKTQGLNDCFRSREEADAYIASCFTQDA